MASIARSRVLRTPLDGVLAFRVARALQQVQKGSRQDGLLAPAHPVLGRIEVFQDSVPEVPPKGDERRGIQWSPRRNVGLDGGVLTRNRNVLLDVLPDFPQHVDELVAVERARVFEVDGAVRIEKGDERQTLRPVLHIGGGVNVRVDEDVDEVLIKVGVDLFPAERVLRELVAPVAPLGREQQEVRPVSLDVALDHVIGVVLKVHPEIVVLVCEGRNGHDHRQNGTSEEKHADAGKGRSGHGRRGNGASKEKRADAGGVRKHPHPRRARSSSTFRRSASLPSSPLTSPASAPSASTRRMVSGWEIE